jgi:SAM-dependent methyltransferase
MIWRWYEERRLRKLASGVSGEVLDIGYAQWPNRHFSGEAVVTGVDLEAGPPAPGYARQLVGDFHGHPELEPGSFDFVVSGEIIEHIEDPYRFLRHVMEMLKPGGELRLSTPNPVAFPVVVLEWTRNTRFFFAHDHRHYIAPRWMAKMLRDVGYVDIRLEPVGLWFPGLPIPWAPIGLSYQVVYRARRPS